MAVTSRRRSIILSRSHKSSTVTRLIRTHHPPHSHSPTRPRHNFSSLPVRISLPRLTSQSKLRQEAPPFNSRDHKSRDTFITRGALTSRRSTAGDADNHSDQVCPSAAPLNQARCSEQGTFGHRDQRFRLTNATCSSLSHIRPPCAV